MNVWFASCIWVNFVSTYGLKFSLISFAYHADYIFWGILLLNILMVNKNISKLEVGINKAKLALHVSFSKALYRSENMWLAEKYWQKSRFLPIQ